MRRLFDITASILGLIVLSPILLLIAVAIKLDSKGPVFHRGLRMGREGKPFRIFKFRTMVAGAERRGPGITVRGDPRITRPGHLLRRTKLDELPQLLNIILGDMSLVGPRPEDPRYLPYYSTRQQTVLSVPPGLTSIASLRYRNEEQLLPPDSWEQVYSETVLPAKLDIELNYMFSRSFGQDLLILVATVFALISDEAQLSQWTRSVTRVEHFVGHYFTWAAIDAPLIIAAYLFSFYIRFISHNFDTAQAVLAGIVCVTIYIVTNYFFGVYDRIWRYATGREAVVIFASAMLGTLVISIPNLFLGDRGVPPRGLWLAGFFVFIFMAGARYRRRLGEGLRQTLQDFIGFASGEGARVLIVGAGEEGQLSALQMQNRLEGRAYEVVGFVDDNWRKQGMRIHNVPVLGDRTKIPELAERLHPDLIVLAIPPSRVRDPQQLLELCRATQAQIKILPSLFDWLGHRGLVPGWQDMVGDNLLQRTLYRVDDKACRELLENRVILVTGAAGSIGSELCQQITAFKPARLVMLDINESGLYDLRTDLKAKAPGLEIELALCDISRREQLKTCLEQKRPQIIFHAAAYKHVPILEEAPGEGVRVNIQGTRNLHALAQQCGVERFVLISTDKAANPKSVLGMTKWIDELIVAGRSQEGTMRSTAVRFGNVLGSRGSVVPTFERQIETGGPVTVTDPNVTRYFISIGEAVSLVLQAAAMTRGGDVYILDMGQPVSILELATRMIRARGLRPGQEIQIQYTGLRPGEKLAEDLVAKNEERLETEHPSIFRLQRTAVPDLARLEQELDALVAYSLNGSTAEGVRGWLGQYVESLQASSMPAAESANVPAEPWIERRAFPRLQVRYAITLEHETEKEPHVRAHAECLNLSGRGLMFETRELYKPGERMIVRFADPDRIVYAHGLVKHCASLQLGTYRIGVRLDDSFEADWPSLNRSLEYRPATADLSQPAYTNG